MGAAGNGAGAIGAGATGAATGAASGVTGNGAGATGAGSGAGGMETAGTGGVGTAGSVCGGTGRRCSSLPSSDIGLAPTWMPMLDPGRVEPPLDGFITQADGSSPGVGETYPPGMCGAGSASDSGDTRSGSSCGSTSGAASAADSLSRAGSGPGAGTARPASEVPQLAQKLWPGSTEDEQVRQRDSTTGPSLSRSVESDRTPPRFPAAGSRVNPPIYAAPGPIVRTSARLLRCRPQARRPESHS